jgi:hypothetical protein
MGPDVLSTGGGTASIVPGAYAAAGISRLSLPARHFLLNRRKWWCCGVRRRKKSSYKLNAVRYEHFWNRRKKTRLFFLGSSE